MTSNVDLTWIIQYREIILYGLFTTIYLTLVVAVLGLVLGLICAWVRVFGPMPARVLIEWYVEIVRNTPFLVQLLFIFFGLPALGLSLSAIGASIAAMTFNLGAYSSEIMRAGIEATPRGQFEAGACLAMGPLEVFRYVVVGPSIARVWPALASQLVIIMLDSAVVSQISVEDLTSAANYIQSRNFRAFETYISVTVVYLMLAMLLRKCLRSLGRKFFSMEGA